MPSDDPLIPATRELMLESGGPDWREGALKRVSELTTLSEWVRESDPSLAQIHTMAIDSYLKAATTAAESRRFLPRSRPRSVTERIQGNLDAAEVGLLGIAPPDYLFDQLPGILAYVRRYLVPMDPRREELERVAHNMNMERDGTVRRGGKQRDFDTKKQQVEEVRRAIVTAVRGASSARLREGARVHSFKNIVRVTAVLMTLLAIGVAVAGWLKPTLMPICFVFERFGEAGLFAQLPSHCRSRPARLRPSIT